MLRWLPLLLLPIVGFAITKNCQNSPQDLSETKEEVGVPESLSDVAVTPTMQVVMKRGSVRQAASAEQTLPRKIKSRPSTIPMIEGSVQQENQMQEDLVIRRDVKDALSEELARYPAEPSKTVETDSFRDDKKWIDSLSGLSLQNNKAKSVKRECNAQRCPPKNPYVNVFGVVFEPESPEMDGKLEQGSFVENTPALYIK